MARRSSSVEPLALLLVEDNPLDARLVMAELEQVEDVRFSVTPVERLAEAVATLAAIRPDVILLDLSLPDSHGLQTFTAVRKAAPTIPVVIFSGMDDNAVALEAVRAGAQDYLVKGRSAGELIARSLRYAIERHRLVQEREEARKQARELSQLIPICASCKQIRDDQGYWNQLERFMEAHTQFAFSHGICPACAERTFGKSPGTTPPA